MAAPILDRIPATLAHQLDPFDAKWPEVIGDDDLGLAMPAIRDGVTNTTAHAMAPALPALREVSCGDRGRFIDPFDLSPAQRGLAIHSEPGDKD